MGKKKQEEKIIAQWMKNLRGSSTAKVPARSASPGLGEQMAAIFSGAENELLTLFDDLAAMESKWYDSIVREYLNEDYVAANAYWYCVLSAYDGDPAPENFVWFSPINSAVLDYKNRVPHKCASGKCAICKIRALLDVYVDMTQR